MRTTLVLVLLLSCLCALTNAHRHWIPHTHLDDRRDHDHHDHDHHDHDHDHHHDKPRKGGLDKSCREEIESLCPRPHKRRMAWLRFQFEAKRRKKPEEEAKRMRGRSPPPPPFPRTGPKNKDEFKSCVKANYKRFTVDCQKAITEKWNRKESKHSGKDCDKKAWAFIKRECPSKEFEEVKDCVKEKWGLIKDTEVQKSVRTVLKEWEAKVNKKGSKKKSDPLTSFVDTMKKVFNLKPPSTSHDSHSHSHSHSGYGEGKKHKGKKHHHKKKRTRLIMAVSSGVMLLCFIALIVKRRRQRMATLRLQATLPMAKENIIIGVPLELKVEANADTPENDNGLPVVDSKVITVV